MVNFPCQQFFLGLDLVQLTFLRRNVACLRLTNMIHMPLAYIQPSFSIRILVLNVQFFRVDYSQAEFNMKLRYNFVKFLHRLGGFGK